MTAAGLSGLGFRMVGSYVEKQSDYLAAYRGLE